MHEQCNCEARRSMLHAVRLAGGVRLAGNTSIYFYCQSALTSQVDEIIAYMPVNGGHSSLATVSYLYQGRNDIDRSADCRSTFGFCHRTRPRYNSGILRNRPGTCPHCTAHKMSGISCLPKDMSWQAVRCRLYRAVQMGGLAGSVTTYSDLSIPPNPTAKPRIWAFKH